MNERLEDQTTLLDTAKKYLFDDQSETNKFIEYERIIVLEAKKIELVDSFRNRSKKYKVFKVSSLSTSEALSTNEGYFYGPGNVFP